MNGFTDVQTALQGRALQEVQPARGERQAASGTPTQPASGRWALYRHRWNTRRTLLELTDEELRDIGLDYTQARIEAAKPFWRE